MSQPSTTYDADSYRSRFLPEKSVFPDDRRIFHRHGFSYETVEAITEVRLEAGVFTARVRLRGGAQATLTLSALEGDRWRLRLRRDGTPTRSPEVAARREMIPVLPAVRADLRLVESAEAYELAVDDQVLRLGREPFSLTLERGGRQLLTLETESIAGDFVVAPIGFRCEGERVEPYLSWHLANDERCFGLGEKWNKVEKSSTRATIWSNDTCGSNTTDLSYKSVPLLFSTRGCGLMLHSSYRSFWEIGTFSYTSASVLTEDPELDLFLFVAPSLRELLGNYTALTGRSALPPPWALGLWMSRCAYAERSQAEAAMRGLREREIPCDVIHLDPLWMRTHYYFQIGVDACDFERNEAGFPDLPGFFRAALEQGFNTCLWINPYLPEGSSIYAEADAKGYLLRSTEGGIARLAYGEPVGMVDFTNRAATEWWKDQLRALLRDGASVFKPDYGDRVPENALGSDGRTGLELHNIYLHLFAEAAYQAALEVRGEGIVWRRAGYLGSQRYPGTWAGDTQATWEGLRHCLRGGLSAGLSGEPFWASDIGGFVGPKPSDELYLRWAEFGMLSALARFHGTSPREPWHYGSNAVEIVRHYTELRYRLFPYLWALAHEAHATGLPLMRHLALEFPDEPNVDTLDDQYCLGPDLLVAPVVLEGARERAVYLPTGTWRELEDPAREHAGGRFVRVAAPLERIPVFVREGAVIPHFASAPQHLKVVPADALVIDVFAGESRRSLRFTLGDRSVALDYTADARTGQLTVGPLAARVTLRLRGFLPGAAKSEGVSLAWSEDRTEATFEGTSGALIEVG